MPRLARILYFIAAMVPTKEEYEAAAALGTRMFRNASLVGADHTPEPCDAVAGAVPAAYEKFPRADAPAPNTSSDEGNAASTGDSASSTTPGDAATDPGAQAQLSLEPEKEQPAEAPAGKRGRK